ncbi:DUF5615 family PIN-like protein [Nocardioides massiliensis]|uniref:Nuclease of putative toxin-antitoxin system n=1 Tax=Nocardioides massiliensis TaxID=1325935 RepID=A0ABT9NUG1_9ACTN|nr:DUF5615 family PIN-like protein [Nocardioides massiliensis]MDP9824068.1 putative nuclease of putative toxin-antitoxin system [Nocardioides massiliensis]
MTPRLLADEHIDPVLVLGLQRRVPGLDIVRVQDVGLRTADDPAILEWAAAEDRILVTRDIKTVPTYAFNRVSAKQPMPGVFVLRSTVSMATAIDELSFIVGASDANEWVDRVVYLPLR